MRLSNWAGAAAMAVGFNVSAQVSVQVPISTGMTLPGTPPGAVLTRFGSIAIGAGGEIAFRGNTSPFPSSEGLWQYAPEDGVQIIAVNGAPVQITPTSIGTFTGANIGVPPIANASGQLFFEGSSRTATGTTSGLLTAGTNGVKFVALYGQAVAGSSFSQFDTGYLEYGISTLNPSGRALFSARLADNRGGLFSSIGAIPRIIALSGDPAPGTDGTFGVARYGAINPLGNVAFTASFADPASRTGVWVTQSGSLPTIPVALQGQVIPSLGSDIKIAFPFAPDVDASNAVSFPARISGTGVTSSNNMVLFYGPADAPAVVLRTGSPPPGLPDLQVGTFGKTQISSSNHMAIVAGLQSAGGPATTSLLAGTPQNLSVVAYEGMHAPGTPADIQFGQVVTRSLYPIGLCDFMWMNHSGQAAFISGLVREGVPPDPVNLDIGAFAVDPFGDLIKIARIGDSLTVAPNDVRTLLSLRWGGNGYLGIDGGPEDGRESNFNDAQQFAMDASFRKADGTLTKSVFIARVGGSARLTGKAPIYGAASTNGFGTAAPIEPFEAIDVTGDSGFVRFKPGAEASVLLDFAGTSAGIDAAFAELVSGQDAFAYSVTAISSDGFDARVDFTSLPSGVDRYFYWNFLNVPDVDLTRVQLVPEPATIATLLALACLAPRRRATA